MRVIYTYSNAPRRPPTGLLGRIAGLIVSVLALAGAAFFGFFIFLFVLGVIIVAGSFIALRVWWFKRQFRSAMNQKRSGSAPRDYIDVEFTERDDQGRQG